MHLSLLLLVKIPPGGKDFLEQSIFVQTLDVSKQARAVEEMRARRTRSVGEITSSDVDFSGDHAEPSNGTVAKNSRKCICRYLEIKQKDGRVVVVVVLRMS